MGEATIPDWLEYVTPIATAIYTLATIVLVAVTIVNVRLLRLYTRTTQHTVEEMRAARAATVKPRLVPVLKPSHGPESTIDARVRIVNIGAGPAFKVDVRLVTEPGGLALHATRRGDHLPVLGGPRQGPGLRLEGDHE